MRARRQVADERAAQPVARDPALAARALDHVEHRRCRRGRCRSAKAIASAAPARLIAASRLLTSFARAPSPGLLPMRNTGSASDSSRPRWRSNTASAQATIRLIVPARARVGPPDIGASMASMPAAARRAAIASVLAGAIVGQSSTHAPAAERGRSAVDTEQHRFALRRVDDGDDHHRAARCQRGRRRRGVRTRGNGERFARRVDVAHMDLAAELAQAQGHRQPHVADADDADAGISHAPIVATMSHPRTRSAQPRGWCSACSCFSRSRATWV